MCPLKDFPGKIITTTGSEVSTESFTKQKKITDLEVGIRSGDFGNKIEQKSDYPDA